MSQSQINSSIATERRGPTSTNSSDPAIILRSQAVTTDYDPPLRRMTPYPTTHAAMPTGLLAPNQGFRILEHLRMLRGDDALPPVVDHRGERGLGEGVGFQNVAVVPDQ